MKYEDYLKKKTIRRTKVDYRFYKNSIYLLNNTLKTIDSLKIEEYSSNTAFKESYDALRYLSEAIGILKGYKFSTHEAIVYFMRYILEEKDLAEKFDNYRLIRNDINYNAMKISKKYAIQAKEDIKSMIEKLKKYLS